VAARSSAFRFQGGSDLRRVGSELGVDQVLEGSVRRSGDRLRIGVRLVNASDGYQLWSERYDRDLEDIFALQDEIAMRVVEALSPQLAGRATPRAKRYTENLEAYQLYLKGRYLWNKRHEGGMREGLEAFQAAIDKDPFYAPAYGGLADSYALLGSWFDVLPAEEAMPRAKAAARRALEIDEALPEAHAALGWVALHYDWDWAAAEQHFRRALALDPARAATRHWYSFFLSAMGRAEEALREARAAWELDPLGLIINANLAQPLYYARRFEEALAAAEKLVRMEPAFPIGHQWLGMTLAALGRWDEAIREIEAFGGAYSPDSHRSGAMIGYLQGRAGRREAAIRCLEELRAGAAGGRSRAIHLAFVHIGLGAHDEAFAALELAYAERSDQLPYLAVEPLFDPLRPDPRFAALLERMHLPATARVRPRSEEPS
jgi:tetratricopeptide (TPR) repeat protein